MSQKKFNLKDRQTERIFFIQFWEKILKDVIKNQKEKLRRMENLRFRFEFDFD